MLRHPSVYAKLLSRFIQKYKIQVWLINTGWFGGAYGVGQRFPLKITRDIIRAIQNDELDKADFYQGPIFGLKIPTVVRAIDPHILNPSKAWGNAESYAKEAKKLEESFNDQLKKIKASPLN
jgi:phosphoenolpyruvate carboxykinase (ATP)